MRKLYLPDKELTSGTERSLSGCQEHAYVYTASQLRKHLGVETEKYEILGHELQYLA